LTVVDQWSRQSPTLEVGFRMDGTTVRNALDAAIVTYGKPASITCDHGSEFMSRVREDWAFTRGVQLAFTRPGKPTDNSFIESFNGKLRDECLNVTQFADLTHAQHVIAAWRIDYTEARPHGALGHLTPKEFAESRQEQHPQEAA
jgi:putative transposase